MIMDLDLVQFYLNINYLLKYGFTNLWNFCFLGSDFQDTNPFVDKGAIAHTNPYKLRATSFQVNFTHHFGVKSNRIRYSHYRIAQCFFNLPMNNFMQTLENSFVACKKINKFDEGNMTLM